MTLKGLASSQALQDLWPTEAHAEGVPKEKKEGAEEAPQSLEPSAVFICPGIFRCP